MLRACTLILAAAVVGAPTAASAYVDHHLHASHYYHMTHHDTAARSVYADGYCDGIVDGSGLRHHCGTATGGVPGGMPNRN